MDKNKEDVFFIGFDFIIIGLVGIESTPEDLVHSSDGWYDTNYYFEIFIFFIQYQYFINQM